jgi:pimeloyl-ACP methyl ester carboxylesterase
VSEQLQIRIHSPNATPTLIYLPGLHGDWTLVGGFREALGGRVRFVEITYPRTLTWSLQEYAAAVEQGLAEQGITQGWLLGESFGSQVAWPILSQSNFRVEGVILAGGFARHPTIWGVRLARRVVGSISLNIVIRILLGYARIARFRFRHSPETVKSIDEFIARRTKLDQQAAEHRLALLLTADPCKLLRETQTPIYALSGLFDPIVPWMFVRRWFRKNCPALRDYRIVRQADHNVLGTAPHIAAEQAIKWMRGERVT